MAEVTSGITLAPPPVRARIARRAGQLRRLPLIPILILSIFVVAGLAAPLLAPHDPERGEVRARNQPPAWLEGGNTKYLLGTDHLGRDMLSRVIYGARISLVVVAVTLGIGGTVGVVLGLVSGYYGGWLEELIMRLVDIKLAIPTILLALVLVLALGQSFLIIVVILAIAIWPRFARNTRGEVLQLKTMDYIALAKVSGASTPRILFKHIFPGVVNTLIILATLEVGIVILLESTLSFLGAGVPPPTPAWGSMVADGRDRLAVAWWISTIPGVAIMLVVLSMNIFGDWLRDMLDPRLRQLE
jgi:peptide/nickel transport system permease protein